jgi:hypothetical protein
MRRRSLYLLLLAARVSFAPGLSAQPTAPTAPTVTTAELAGPGLRLRVSTGDGHVESLQDGAGRTLAGTARDSVGLWSLDRAPGAPPIAAAEAGRFVWRRTDARTLELTWDHFPAAVAPRLRVVATAQLRADTTVAWRIRLDGIRGVGVEGVHFPRVGGVALGEGTELAVPVWMGQRARNPRALLAGPSSGGPSSGGPSSGGPSSGGPNGVGRRLEWAYPGNMSLQLVALSSARTGGLYLAADDTLAYRKSFALAGAPDGTAAYEMVHLPSDPGRDDRYAPAYASLVGVVPGDWLSAVERYRAWGTRQSWARRSRLATGASPPWVRNTGIWVWNRGRSDAVLAPAALLQRDAGLPVSVFWHWWHRGPYDTSFPEYLPPREGAVPFVDAVRRAHDAGLHAIVYMNQRLWCTGTPSWRSRGAERWAVRERDGRVRLETYNVFDPQPCATMDVATPFWRDTYAGIADTVLNQYGLDGIYMDQAVLSLVDWNPDHGHPVGGGHYWMDGFRALAADLRRRGGPGGARAIALGGEGGGESWLPDLDAFLTLQVSQERYADPASGWEVVPMFQAAYHPYAVTYGTYGSLTYPPYDALWPDSTRPANALTPLDAKYARQFRLEQARMFVWGMQPTIANFLPEQLTARRTELDYLERLARLRYGLRAFFLDGTFLRPPPVDVPASEVLLSRISIYAARRGGPVEARLTSPDVLAGAWRAPDGRVAVALASIADSARTATVRIGARAYGLPAGTRIVRHDEAGRHPLGTLGAGARTLTVPVAAGEGVVLELVPPQ